MSTSYTIVCLIQDEQIWEALIGNKGKVWEEWGSGPGLRVQLQLSDVHLLTFKVVRMSMF